MITSNFIHRTFFVRSGAGTGTAFTVDVDGRQYLITARHVLSGPAEAPQIEVFGNGKWRSIDAALVGNAAEPADVTVLAPANLLTPYELPVTANSEGLMYGQDVYFLGFPYGMLSRYAFGSEGYPLAFVKKAVLSLMDGDVYYLDGHNNPGFSGGPAIFGRQGRTPTTVAAVVCAYRSEMEPVWRGRSETEFVSRHNTGIVVCYRIEVALEVIRANPIGTSVVL